MKKSDINSMITGLSKANMATKVSPWFFEERGGEKIEVRYVGLKLGSDWDEIFSTKNLILLAFNFSKQTQVLDIFLANSTPFIKLMNFELLASSKVEVMLGELKHMLKVDKSAVLHHKDQIGNLYKKIQPKLKK